MHLCTGKINKKSKNYVLDRIFKKLQSLGLLTFVIDEMPQNMSGKIDCNKLIEMVNNKDITSNYLDNQKVGYMSQQSIDKLLRICGKFEEQDKIIKHIKYLESLGYEVKKPR